MNVIQAITKVKHDIGAIGKGGTMKGGSFSYKYRSIDDVLNQAHDALVAHGLVFVPKLVSHAQSGKTTLVDVEYTVYGPEGDCITARVPGEGDDSGDKGTNKAMTGALKVFLTQTFAIPFDTDDPDDYPSAPREAKKPETKAATPAAKVPDSKQASAERKCETCTFTIGSNDPIKRMAGKYHHKACLEGKADAKPAPAADDISSIIDEY